MFFLFHGHEDAHNRFLGSGGSRWDLIISIASRRSSFPSTGFQKLLSTNDRFSGISTEVKTPYGILLDCINLSAKKTDGWGIGRDVPVSFTVEGTKVSLPCGNQRVISLLAELENKVGLIARKHHGPGKPNSISANNFLNSGISAKDIS